MNLRSGYPFGLIQNGLLHDYPKLETSLKTDVVIMGGGISGALAAYCLVNAGVDCILIDARTIGLGSTCASTSLLQYEIDTPLSRLKDLRGYKNAVASYRLCAYSINRLGEIAASINFSKYRFTSSLYYAANKKDITFLKDEYKIRKENGFAVEFLGQGDIEKEYHFLADAAILSAIAAETDAYAFTHALLQSSKAAGLKVYDRTRAMKIDHNKTDVTIKTEENYVIQTKKLIYATGYEAVNYINKKIVALHSTYAVISEHFNRPQEFWKDNSLIWNTADPYLYIRTTPDNRIIVGGRDEKFYNPERRDKLISKKSKQLAKDFTYIFPQINFREEFSWAGTFGSTTDGLPFIGCYPKLKNSFFALGFGGNGITFSLIAAEILTDLIKGVKNTNAALFAFERI